MSEGKKAWRCWFLGGCEGLSRKGDEENLWICGDRIRFIDLLVMERLLINKLKTFLVMEGMEPSGLDANALPLSYRHS